MIDFEKAFVQGEKIVEELSEIYNGPPEHFAEAVKLIIELPPDPAQPENDNEKQTRVASMLAAFYMAHTITQNPGIRKEPNTSE